jgi:hypothetical protein
VLDSLDWPPAVLQGGSADRPLRRDQSRSDSHARRTARSRIRGPLTAESPADLGPERCVDETVRCTSATNPRGLTTGFDVPRRAFVAGHLEKLQHQSKFEPLLDSEHFFCVRKGRSPSAVARRTARGHLETRITLTIACRAGHAARLAEFTLRTGAGRFAVPKGPSGSNSRNLGSPVVPRAARLTPALRDATMRWRPRPDVGPGHLARPGVPPQDHPSQGSPRHLSTEPPTVCWERARSSRG